MASQPDLYVGKQPVTFDHEGSPVFVGPTTVVRKGHPIMKGREDLFEPLTVHFDLAEQKAPSVREEAETLGIRVDGRWSDDRIREEIEKRTS